MVHVSADAGGRHKMLAFSPPAEPTFTGIDSIIKVNTKEAVTFNDSSNPSSTTSNHHNGNSTVPIAPPPTTHDFHSVGIIGLNHHQPGKASATSTSSSSPIVPKTILKNTLNSLDKSGSSPKYRLSDKMFADEDSPTGQVNNNGNNGNDNYLADTINSNSNNETTTNSSTNNRMRGGGGGNNMTYDKHGLDLISHGLTDSVCDTIKLLEGDYDKKCSTTTASLSSGISASSSSTSGGLGGGVDEVASNVVYTEEIVISTARSNSSAVTGMTKPGIMKTFSTFSPPSSTSNTGGGGGGHPPVIHRNRIISSTEQWKNQLNEEIEEEEAMSQSNESEETPLLTAAEHPSTTNVTHGSDNISNDSLPGSGSGAGGANAPSSAMHKVGKVTNGTKATGLKRVSFGSSKGSMVETLIYESPVSDEPGKSSGKGGTLPILTNGTAASCRNSSKGEAVQDSPDSTTSGGSTGGSRPPSRVRVTFFESEKPLAVSSPESDILDFDLSKMTIHGSPTVHDPSSPSYNRQISVEGWDNPFRPDGDLSKEADQIVELIKEGKPINDETLRSKSPSVNEPMLTSSSIPTQNQLNASPKGKEVNGSATNGTNGPVDIQHTVVAPAAQAGQVEHVVLKKKKGCCVIQ